jgi:hypothetical protein
MRTKAFDHLSGGVERAGIFNAGTKQPERKIPPGVSGWLQQYGLSVDSMYASGNRFTVNQLDSFFATRDVSTSDRMSIKSTLAQFNLLAE